jgi:hypothetical protein
MYRYTAIIIIVAILCIIIYKQINPKLDFVVYTLYNKTYIKVLLWYNTFDNRDGLKYRTYITLFNSNRRL